MEIYQLGNGVEVSEEQIQTAIRRVVGGNHVAVSVDAVVEYIIDSCRPSLTQSGQEAARDILEKPVGEALELDPNVRNVGGKYMSEMIYGGAGL